MENSNKPKSSQKSKARGSKGILKITPGFRTPASTSLTSSVEKTSHSSADAKAAHFDEMNIIETLHPAEKDYGHMKILEPNTPYNYEYKGVDDTKPVDHEQVMKKLQQLDLNDPDSRVKPPTHESEDVTPTDDILTEEERKKHQEFKNKRKSHYNEYETVLAMKNKQKLMKDDDIEDQE